MGAPKITSLENGRCLVIHYDPYGRFFGDPRPSLDFHVMAAMARGESPPIIDQRGLKRM